MNIQTTKLEIVKAILEIDNIDFFEKVADLIKKEKPDFWSELSTSEQNEIKKGIDELDNGKRATYDSFLKKIS